MTHFTDILTPLLFLLWRLYVELTVKTAVGLHSHVQNLLTAFPLCLFFIFLVRFPFSWLPFPSLYYLCINYVNIGVKEVSALRSWSFRQL